MTNYEEWRNKQLENPEFRAEYEKLRPEFDIIFAMAEARRKQNITQEELARRTGISQADISKLENGTRNPSLNLLKRIAAGMGTTLKIEFIPNNMQQ